jgi:hypothetical protein
MVAAARAAVPGAGARIPGVGAKMSQLGAECCHLAREVLDVLQKCVALGEWSDARERRLECGLYVAVCAVGRGV